MNSAHVPEVYYLLRCYRPKQQSRECVFQPGFSSGEVGLARDSFSVGG
jgi:hypothetical protein